MDRASDEWDWDEEVTLTVTVRVKARKGEHFENWTDGYSDTLRTPQRCAIVAVLTGISDLDRLDGFADLEGYADIIDVDEWP